MLRIGITGGIGSGKTTVTKLFEELGVPVYYTDIEAKRVAQEDPEVVKEIVRVFGTEAYVNGEMDHKRMASIVFYDKEKLEALNNIVHPAAQKHWEEWADNQAIQKTHKFQPPQYVIREIAILFETGAEKTLDYVIGVEAPEELRIERVIARNGTTREEVLSRIRSQMPEEEKLRKCDFIVLNDGNTDLMPQVLELDDKFNKANDDTKTESAREKRAH
jgi:dephospho-CoA kinase